MRGVIKWDTPWFFRCPWDPVTDSYCLRLGELFLRSDHVIAASKRRPRPKHDVTRAASVVSEGRMAREASRDVTAAMGFTGYVELRHLALHLDDRSTALPVG